MKNKIIPFAAILVVAAAVCSAGIKPHALVVSARSQIGVTTAYDPAYRMLEYPGGDVPKKVGVCSDVVIRALRETEARLRNHPWSKIKDRVVLTFAPMGDQFAGEQIQQLSFNQPPCPRKPAS